MNRALHAAGAACVALVGCGRRAPVGSITPESATAQPSVAPVAPVVTAAALASTPPLTSASVATPQPPPPLAERAWRSCAEATGAAKATYTSLREVDWCNREYVPGFATLRKGRAEIHEYEELGGLHDTDIFRLGSVAYGDLDGDGVEEAVVVLDQESYAAKAGQHLEARVFVFALRGGKVVGVAQASTHVGSVASVRGNRARLDYGEPGAPRCTHELRLDATKLVTASDPCVDLK